MGLVQAVVERGARNILQHQVVEALLGMKVVHRFDVGMVEPAEDEGFAAKAGLRGDVAQGFGIQHLDRDIAFQALVARAINNPHTTGADLLDKPEMAQNLPGAWRRRSHAANRMTVSSLRSMKDTLQSSELRAHALRPGARQLQLQCGQRKNNVADGVINRDHQRNQAQRKERQADKIER